MAKVLFSKESLEVIVDKPVSVLSLALEQGIPMTHRCGAELQCASCKIRVLEGMEGLSLPSTAEQRMLAKHQFPPFIRLGCQATIQPEYQGLIEVGTIIKDQAKRPVRIPARFLKKT